MHRDEQFRDFFVARAPALRRTAYLIVGDWHAAEDVTQLGLARLYVVWPRVRVETADAYARRIVVNEALGWLRRTRRESAVEAVPDLPGPTVAESPLDIGSALALLPGQQRAIIALRYVDDLSVAEVARVLDIAEGTVKSQTSRALDTLRSRLPELVLSEETR
ncbi:SigE family RNA polymerase sigma factor [Nocardioides sp.]|uniref:SigE family RNA polymerase sigma factor n=1 Tax=Nocardioides sp. TaxID=35761 RepID=UPI003D0A8B1E